MAQVSGRILISNFADHGITLAGQTLSPTTAEPTRWYPHAYAEPCSVSKPGFDEGGLKPYATGRAARAGYGPLPDRYVTMLLAREGTARTVIRQSHRAAL